MLILHHLQISQSERVTWLLEELEIPYKLVTHIRDPTLSPDSLKNVPGNITGKSPFLEDTDAGISLSESAAICEYVINRYGDGRLEAKPLDKNYPDYLQWFHFANGTLQPAMVDRMFLAATNATEETPIVKIAATRLDTALSTLNARLKDQKWLAGEFSAADIMTLYVTSTQRYFGPQIDLGSYAHILRWMKDCSERPAYQKAMDKADPEMKRLLHAEPPSISMGAAGGAKSDHWKN